jgi:hypothetical protein
MQDIDNKTDRPQLLISGEIHGDERVVSIYIYISIVSVAYKVSQLGVFCC